MVSAHGIDRFRIGRLWRALDTHVSLWMILLFPGLPWSIRSAAIIVTVCFLSGLRSEGWELTCLSP